MKKTVVLLICVVSFCAKASASVEDDLKIANRLYNNKSYREAAGAYQEVLKKRPAHGIANFNLGAALYREGSYSQSIDSFNKAITSGRDDMIQTSDYNIGNAYYRIGIQKEQAQDIESAKRLYESALKYYKRSMALNVKDRDAKFNYEFVNKKLKELKEKKNQEKKQDNQKNRNQKQDQNNNNKQNQPNTSNQQKNQQGQGGQSSQNQQSKGENNEKSKGSGQSDQNKEGKNQQDKGGGGKQEKSQQSDQEKQKEANQKSQGSSETKEENQPQEKSQGGQKGQDGQSGEKKEEPDKKKSEQGKEEESKGASQGETQEQPPMPENEPVSGKQEKGKAGDNSNLQFYQSPQREGEEMSEQQAKMLLEGYKGEEATGRVIRMRRQKIDLAEPEKDW